MSVKSGKRAGVREGLKTAALAGLILSALYLTWQTWFFSMPEQAESLLALFKKEAQLPASYAEYEEYAFAADAMTPLRGAVRGADGLYGVWDRDGARALYERARSLLSEAFASLGGARLVTTQEWKAALLRRMLLFDFEGEVPLASLTKELGVTAGGSLPESARYLMLSAAEDGTVYLYSRADSRRLYRCATKLSADELSSFAAGYGQNGCYLGAELSADETGGVDAPAELLFFYNRLQPSALSSYRVLDELTGTEADRVVNALLTAFGSNPYTTESYTEEDGARVYVDRLRTVRLYGDGRVSFYAPDADAGAKAAEPDAEECTTLIGRAGRLLEQAVAPYMGDAEVYIVRAYYNGETDRYVVLVGCEVGGVPVLYDGGYMARVEFSGGELVAADLRLDGYRRSGVGSTLPPERQALAAASADGTPASFGLYYRASGESVLNAAWYAAK